MNAAAYPALADFLTHWFTNDHDFDELGDVLALMQRLDDGQNLRDLQDEVRRIQAEQVTLAEFNAFSRLY